ncbi:MAG: membrane protein insertion efficiency factor YidD [Desulfohalobiaceae bacterium]|nr:membrane protein insertion efficiency factor YidD [Desulfohalobiaceae bacterium]MCF8104380.1 membrane protein insertion efficiency factor YidD [Desulfohalobiaceae bacterium]
MYQPLIWLIRVYQWTVSPFLPPSCRFHPCCSEYALQALKIHGPLMGGLLILKRLVRCHPLAQPGFDPVPDKGRSEK